MDVSRLPHVTEKDLARLEQYKRVKQRLLEAQAKFNS